MRIQRLDLRAFGPFTNVSLDLSAGREGLHLIYGPNEAGKSSALRALRQMLYGIPNQSTDDFVHPHRNLRIGAELLRGDGTPFEFLRRKGNRNTLLATDDETPIADEALRQILGGLELATFESMFGLDHVGLVKGGSDLAAGGGELGQVLFAAGAGIAGLNELQKSLEKEADELFTQRGKNQQINKRLSELEKARAALRDAQLPSNEWLEHERKLEAAQARLQEIRAQIHAIGRERGRLERLRAALPLFAQRTAARAKLDQIGSVPSLAEGFADARRDAVAGLDAARAVRETAERAMGEIETQLAAQAAPEPLAAEAEGMKALSEELGSHRKAARDLPRLRASLQHLEADARAILAELRPELTLTDAESLRLTQNQQVAIQNLGNRHEALVRRTTETAAEIQAREAELTECRARLARLPAARDPAELAAALERVRPACALETQRAALRSEWEQQERQAGVELARLPLWQGPLAELETLAVPALETLAEFTSEFEQVERAEATATQELAAAEHEAAEVDRLLAEFRRQGEVPTEADLHAARSTRDEAWQQIRNHPAKPSVSELAAYEQLVAAADHLADRLRREAQRVTELVHLESRRNRTADQLARLAAQLERVTVDRARLVADWEDLWAPCGLTPRSPREMRAWCDAQRALVEKAALLRKQRAQVEEIDARLAQPRGELLRALDRLGAAPPTGGESLAQMASRAGGLLEQVRSVERDREQLTAQLARLTDRLAEGQASATQAAEQLAAWQGQWQTALAPLGLDASATPAQVNACLSQIRELFAKLHDATTYSARIAEIAGDSAQFAERVERVVARVAPALADWPPEEAVEELSRRVTQATLLEAERRSLASQLAERKAEQSAAARQCDHWRSRLTALCQEAGCERPEQLPAVEQRVAEHRTASAQLSTLEQRLLELAGGMGVDDFRAEAVGIDASELEERLREQAEQSERLEHEQSALNQTVGVERNELARMDGQPTAALAAETVQGLLAEIESHAREYVRLKTAAEVLRAGIERYREQEQGPVLERASRYFTRLTLGIFSGLRPDVADDKPVLVGIRAVGQEPVPINGMSEGTADQLYLALRLATLEAWFEKHEPMPLILDDILINFDNPRAEAALSVLAEFSTRTQVIFFTHHEHLLELAQRAVDPDVAILHALPTRAGITSQVIGPQPFDPQDLPALEVLSMRSGRPERAR